MDAHIETVISPRPTIANRRLQLFTDTAGNRGIEYHTDVGRIDILTIDEEGDFFVFELKVSRGARKTVAQLLSYMGWVKVHLAGQREVYGVVVAKRADEKLVYACLSAHNVVLLEYQLGFRLQSPKLGERL